MTVDLESLNNRIHALEAVLTARHRVLEHAREDMAETREQLRQREAFVESARMDVLATAREIETLKNFRSEA